MPAAYKELWNQRYAERYDAALEGGATRAQAESEAEVYANETFEHIIDAADNLRKARKENS